MIIQSGYYQHFKGAIYPVIGTANHTETKEKFVLYRGDLNPLNDLYNELWIRPLYSFIEYVDGQPRFRRIK